MISRLLFFITLLLIGECVLAQDDAIIIRKRPTKKGEKWENRVPIPTTPIKAPGPITKEDFKVDEPGASAIYLLNEGYTDIRFHNDAGTFMATTKKLVRIKVLTSAGFDLGNFKIPLYVGGSSAKKSERIREIKAATYNLNEETGQIEVSLLGQEQIFRTAISENVEEVSFALPNVKVNTIIQVSYIVQSPFLTRLDDWYFQKDHPVKKSSYIFNVIGPVGYAFALQGQEQFSNGKTSDSRGMVSLGTLRPYYKDWWYAEDIPAYRHEPFTSTREDDIAKISMQLVVTPTRTFLKSWEDVTQDLQESKRFNQFYTGKKDFSILGISPGVSSLARVQYVYQNFKKQFHWDGKFNVYPNVSFRELTGKKEGNTSSLGLALYQILRQTGYQVDAVLLSPRHRGKINRNYPFIDHLVATVVRLKLDGKVYLLDPLHDVPFGFLDKSFLNGEGLVLSDSVEWQELSLGLKDYKTSQTKISVTEDRIVADIELNMKDYGVIPTDIDLVNLFKSDWELSKLNMDKNETTTQQLTAKIEREVEDDLILIPISFDRIIFSENPFNSEERLYSIDFLYNKQYSFKLEVNLSEEFEFDSFPESKIVKTADGKLSAVLNVNQLGQKLNLTFLFWTKTNTFDVGYYPHLQSAYQLMAELAEGSIIVRRKY